MSRYRGGRVRRGGRFHGLARFDNSRTLSPPARVAPTTDTPQPVGCDSRSSSAPQTPFPRYELFDTDTPPHSTNDANDDAHPDDAFGSALQLDLGPAATPAIPKDGCYSRWESDVSITPSTSPEDLPGDLPEEEQECETTESNAQGPMRAELEMYRPQSAPPLIRDYLHWNTDELVAARAFRYFEVTKNFILAAETVRASPLRTHKARAMVDRLVVRTLSSLSLKGLEEFTLAVEQRLVRWTKILVDEAVEDERLREELELGG